MVENSLQQTLSLLSIDAKVFLYGCFKIYQFVIIIAISIFLTNLLSRWMSVLKPKKPVKTMALIVYATSWAVLWSALIYEIGISNSYFGGMNVGIIVAVILNQFAFSFMAKKHQNKSFQILFFILFFQVVTLYILMNRVLVSTDFEPTQIAFFAWDIIYKIAIPFFSIAEKIGLSQVSENVIHLCYVVLIWVVDNLYFAISLINILLGFVVSGLFVGNSKAEFEKAKRSNLLISFGIILIVAISAAVFLSSYSQNTKRNLGSATFAKTSIKQFEYAISPDASKHLMFLHGQEECQSYDIEILKKKALLNFNNKNDNYLISIRKTEEVVNNKDKIIAQNDNSMAILESGKISEKCKPIVLGYLGKILDKIKWKKTLKSIKQAQRPKAQPKTIKKQRTAFKFAFLYIGIGLMMIGLLPIVGKTRRKRAIALYALAIFVISFVLSFVNEYQALSSYFKMLGISLGIIPGIIWLSQNIKRNKNYILFFLIILCVYSMKIALIFAIIGIVLEFIDLKLLKTQKQTTFKFGKLGYFGVFILLPVFSILFILVFFLASVDAPNVPDKHEKKLTSINIFKQDEGNGNPEIIIEKLKKACKNKGLQLAKSTDLIHSCSNQLEIENVNDQWITITNDKLPGEFRIISGHALGTMWEFVAKTELDGCPRRFIFPPMLKLREISNKRLIAICVEN